jgi:hypothetical protein
MEGTELMSNDWQIVDVLDMDFKSGKLAFWVSMIKQIVARPTGEEIVLDYGCRDGEFLRLLNKVRPFKKGIGVMLDSELIHDAQRGLKPDDSAVVQFESRSAMDGYQNYFDLAFVYETLWRVGDLKALAMELFSSMKDKSECYVAFGSHIENPLWPHRRRMLKEQGYEVFDYSVEDVADTFFEAGFLVGIKRLPVEYFNMYDPRETRKFSISLSDLVVTTEEHKMLFYFRKDNKWRSEWVQRYGDGERAAGGNQQRKPAVRAKRAAKLT